MCSANGSQNEQHRHIVRTANLCTPSLFECSDEAQLMSAYSEGLMLLELRVLPWEQFLRLAAHSNRRERRKQPYPKVGDAARLSEHDPRERYRTCQQRRDRKTRTPNAQEREIGGPFPWTQMPRAFLSLPLGVHMGSCINNTPSKRQHRNDRGPDFIDMGPFHG